MVGSRGLDMARMSLVSHRKTVTILSLAIPFKINPNMQCLVITIQISY